MAKWNFFTNYGHTLFMIALDPDISVRDIAENVGITERAALRIISELVRDEFVIVTKHGRRNSYAINMQKHLRHQIEENCKVGDVIKLIKKSKNAK